MSAGNAHTAASISTSSSERQLFQLMEEALHYHRFNSRLRRENHGAFELISGAVMEKERKEERAPRAHAEQDEMILISSANRL